MMRPADYAWSAIIGGAVVYEIAADDLLSQGTDRYRAAHPVLMRMVVIALAGHFGGMLPHQLDVFDAKNLLHRFVVTGHRKLTLRHRQIRTWYLQGAT